MSRRPRLLPTITALLAAAILATGCTDPSEPTSVDWAGDSVSDSVGVETVDGLFLATEPAVNADDVAPYEMSQAQQTAIDSNGRPDRFVVQFLPRSDQEASTIRQESWYYDRSGTVLVFLDGASFRQEYDREPVTSARLASTRYHPELFTAGMPIDEFLAVTGEPGYARQQIDPALGDGGWLIFITGAVATFDTDGLQFVETLPIEPD